MYEEPQHLATPKLLPNDDLLGRVDPMIPGTRSWRYPNRSWWFACRGSL